MGQGAVHDNAHIRFTNDNRRSDSQSLELFQIFPDCRQAAS